MKFKVGDKVIVFKGNYAYTKPGSKGEVISDSEYNGCVRVRFSYLVRNNGSINKTYPIDECNLKLLNESLDFNSKWF